MTQSGPPSDWQVTQLLAQVLAKLDVVIAQNADHEARLRLLERGRWPQTTIVTLAAVAALAVTVLIAIFKH